MREQSAQDISERLERTFGNRVYRRNVERSMSANWLDLSYDEVVIKLLAYVKDVIMV